MKITGVIFLVLAALNILIAIMAASSGAGEAVSQKIIPALLLEVIGGVLLYFVKRKETKENVEEILAKQQKEEERQQALLTEQKRREFIRQQQLLEQKKKDKETKKQEKLESNSHKYKILYFYLDCSHCHEQEKEIQKCELALPVELIDVIEEEEIAHKYKVNNLSKLILVDYNGREIKRWKGVTKSIEINNYLYANRYAEEKYSISKTIDIENILDDDDEDCEDYPKPMFSLTKEDMQRLTSGELMYKGLCIAADGGTKEQTQVKFEVLLGKREKTEAMLAVENLIRESYDKLYEEAAKIASESSDNAVIRNLSIAINIMKTCTEINKKGSEFYEAKKEMIKLANKFCVSVNIIEKEEQEKIQAKYTNKIKTI